MAEVSPSFKKKKNYQSVMKKSQLNQKNKERCFLSRNHPVLYLAQVWV